MEEKNNSPSEDSKFLKKEILENLRHIEIVQNQSINRFDHPEVYERVFDLLDVLDGLGEDLKHLIGAPTPEKNQFLQDVFFCLKKLRQTSENLRFEPQKLSLQNDFKEAIEGLKEELHRMNLSH